MRAVISIANKMGKFEDAINQMMEELGEMENLAVQGKQHSGSLHVRASLLLRWFLAQYVVRTAFRRVAASATRCAGPWGS